MRIFLFAFDANNNRRLITVVITSSITVVLASLAWIYMGIYENYLNNILEAFYMANLCVFEVFGCLECIWSVRAIPTYGM